MSRKKRKATGAGSSTARDSAPARSGGGLMAMRRGIQGAVGSGGKATRKPPTVLGRIVDVGFWILTIAVIGFVLYARFVRR